jgi:GTP-binding protein
LKITSSRFERAASGPADEPQAPGPDVVFVGRSNVGKSSLINRMLGTKNLARTSSQPGRTQSVNFYRVNESSYFVDLPGYGWAKVPETVRRSWKPMVEACLARRRERLALALLIVDSRHEASELDLVMREWLETEQIPYVVAATKSDKLTARGRARSERNMLEGFGDCGVAGRPLMVSVRSGVGIRELWRYVDAALGSWWESVGAESGAPRPVPR